MSPVESANDFLPKDTSILNAFEKVALKHVGIIGGVKTIEDIKSIPIESLSSAAGDFFTAGVAYLANRGHDAYIQDVGITAWWAVNQKRAITAMVDNMFTAAVALGVPAPIAARGFIPNDEPHLVMFGKQEGKVMIEGAYVLMPPEFIVRARNNAIEGLATMAYICSELRDLMNGRLKIDEQLMNPRAWATESHFLQKAIEKHPSIQLSDVFLEVIRRYPNGLDDLPAKARYKTGIGTNGLQNFLLN